MNINNFIALEISIIYQPILTFNSEFCPSGLFKNFGCSLLSTESSRTTAEKRLLTPLGGAGLPVYSNFINTFSYRTTVFIRVVLEFTSLCNEWQIETAKHGVKTDTDLLVESSQKKPQSSKIGANILKFESL